MFVLREFYKNGTIVNREIGNAYSLFNKFQATQEDAPNEVKHSCFFKAGDNIEAVIWCHGINAIAIPLVKGMSYIILNDNGNVFERIEYK